eukprot:13985301-Ditylum_brightwellii.AAC.1
MADGGDGNAITMTIAKQANERFGKNEIDFSGSFGAHFMGCCAGLRLVFNSKVTKVALPDDPKVSSEEDTFIECDALVQWLGFIKCEEIYVVASCRMEKHPLA